MKKIAILPLLYFMFSAACAHAGVVIGGTRFIYVEGAPGISFRVINEDDFKYLVVTKITPDDGKYLSGTTTPHSEATSAPFVATPPMLLLKDKHEGVIRIMKTADTFPRDRESLSWVSIASIPAKQSATSENSLQVAVRAHMKLIYRPKGLQGKPESAYSQLKWVRSGSQVSVTNPTPWYVTLVQLQSNGKTVPEPGMVAPFSTRKQTWCPAEGSCQLQWQSINDYGAIMPSRRTTL